MEVELTVSSTFDECEPICLGKPYSDTSNNQIWYLITSVASFPNGKVGENSIKRPKMSLMRKVGERNARKRVIVGEAGNMMYSGTNFETEGGLYTPSYCKSVCVFKAITLLIAL